MPDYLAPYNIVWDTPSRHSGESMPCGGHDIGLNVWVEADEAGTFSSPRWRPWCRGPSSKR
mgnify:CR=1 FL=1